MDKIETDDVFEMMSDWSWVHCHPDKVDEIMVLLGWSDDDVIIEYIESDDGEHYFCSVRRKSSCSGSC